MAAEKLTKGRLAQIIILMIVLITAFIWRTVTYTEKPIDKSAITCSLNIGQCNFVDNNETMQLILKTSDPKPKKPIALELIASNVQQIPTATVSGVTMNMGIIPLIFTKTDHGFKAELTVPACTQKNMTWLIRLNINNKVHLAKFTVVN